MRSLVLLEGVPEGDDQRLAILQIGIDGATGRGALVGDLAAVQGDEAANEAGVGMIGLDVLAEQGNPLLQIIDRVFRLQNDAVDGDDPAGVEVGNQIVHRCYLSVDSEYQHALIIVDHFTW